MALDRDDYTRMARYLSGEMAGNERHSFETWLRENPAKAASFSEMGAIWNNSGVRAVDPDVETDVEWAALQRVIQTNDDKEVVIDFQSSAWIKIAAAVLVTLIAAVWLLRTVDSPEDAHIVAAVDSVRTIYLPDSSQIWLNAGSSLAYEKDFGEKDRHVRLRGEGYFKVTPDKSRPFIIETGKASVRVLGTAFNLKENDSTVVLVVEEGLVRFSPRDSVRFHPIFVAAGETATARKKGNPTKGKFANGAYGSWRKKSNPLYEREKQSPGSFIHPQFDWRKNTINQSVIQGKLVSSSDLAVYRDIVLHVAYTNAKGRAMETEFQVAGPIRPGEVIDFEKRLFDIFRDTRTIKVTIKSANVEE